MIRELFALVFLSFFVFPLTSYGVSKEYEFGQRVGDFVGWHATADAFKLSKCRYAISNGNPKYLRHDHFKEAVLYIRSRYPSSLDVQNSMSNEAQISKMRYQLMTQSALSLSAALGQEPTPQMCGFMNAEIDNQIAIAKGRLP